MICRVFAIVKAATMPSSIEKKNSSISVLKDWMIVLKIIGSVLRSTFLGKTVVVFFFFFCFENGLL